MISYILTQGPPFDWDKMGVLKQARREWKCGQE